MTEAVDLKWDEHGLIPAVVQDAASGQVLMVAWMNAEALRLTQETGEAHFWSRSRQVLWHKGATSGHTQRVCDIRVDCDGDTLLVRVDPAGPACHTGHISCFYRDLQGRSPSFSPVEIVAHLESVIADRQRHPKDGSYTTSLLTAGLPEMSKKVGEEGVEVAVAALVQSEGRLLSEAADLVYHLFVLLRARGLNWAGVTAELEKRFR